MNIFDRGRLYREIRRVLKSGGRFATFDVVLGGGQPDYPLPWARTPATSFLMDETIEALPVCVPAGTQPKYGPVLYGDYLMERIDKNYHYRKKKAAEAAGA